MRQPPTSPGPTPTGAILPVIESAFDRSTLGLIRRELGRYGRAAGLNDRLLSNLVLAVNEMTTNAVRHGGGSGHFSLWRDDRSLWCVITDRGNGIAEEFLERAARRRPGYVGGHGLWLTRHICDEVDIETDRDSGTRVILRYDLPPRST